MIVCGRQKRHSVTAATRVRATGAAIALIARRRAPQARGERRSARTPRRRPSPATQRAQRRAVIGSCDGLARARSRPGDAPGRGLAARDRDPVALPRSSPARRRRLRTSSKPAACIQRAVLVLAAGRASTGRRGAGRRGRSGGSGPTTSATPPGLEHAVGLGERGLRVRPVLDRAARDVAVEAVGLERQRLGVALARSGTRAAPACAAHARAGAGSGRASSRGWRRRGRRCPPSRSRSRRRRRPSRAPRSSSRASSSACVAHVERPEQRVDPAVVERREEAVEPERLALVLDQPHGRVTATVPPWSRT